MHLVNGRITRPDTNIHFYLISDELVTAEIKAYWQTNYKDTGKCLHVEVTESSDSLTLETQQYWESNQAYIDFLTDSYLVTDLFAVRDTYWNTNGVVAVVISEEQI